MHSPLRAFIDPSPKRFLLLRRELAVALRRRHHLIRIVAENALDGFAVRAPAGHDGDGAVVIRLRLLLLIEPQVSLALRLVRTVALEAVLAEDRLDVAIKVHRPRGSRGEAGGSR